MADKAELGGVVSRIQKLQQMTEKNGCTEAEALAAAGRIATLLDKHNLSLSDVAFQNEAARTPQGAQALVDLGLRDYHPVYACVDGIGKFFDCVGWALTMLGFSRKAYFLGFREDVAASVAMLALVKRAMEDDWGKYRRRYGFRGRDSYTTRLRKDYMLGYTLRINQRLREMKAVRSPGEVSAEGTQLVPYKAAQVAEWATQRGLDNLETRERVEQATDEHAVSAGYQDAANVTLQKGLSTHAEG